MPDCTPIIVAADQDKKHNLVAYLKACNAQAAPGQYVKVDVNWFIDGHPVMFDIKTPSDLVASQRDGRLHEQILHMQNAGCLFWGIYQTGSWYDGCGLDEDAFDNLRARMQNDGAKIIEVQDGTDFATARRLASFWRWTRDSMDKAGSYHVPEVIIPANDLKREPQLIFWDATFRSQVGMIMHIPTVGPVLANDLRERNPLMSILGSTEEGLTRARDEIWLPTKGVGKKTVEQLWKYMHA